MLHAKFENPRLSGPRLSGPGEDNFLRFLPYMVMAAILDMCLGLLIYTLLPTS